MTTYKISEFNKFINNYSNKNTVIYLQNWGCGFGSALVCLIDNMVYLKRNNIDVIPLWNNNTNEFKYSNGFDDCFKEIFDDKYIIRKNANIIYVNSNLPHILPELESRPTSNLTNVKNEFNNRFSIKQKYYDRFNELVQGKEITFSIHLRSNYQKRIHYNNNQLNIQKIVDYLYKKYGKDCTPFIATDVELYLDYFLLYFPNAIYNKNSFRCYGDRLDSVPLIKEVGVKHAEDVILDIIGLSKGNDIYMSESNFYILVKFLIDDNKQINNLSLIK
jgi:hypothetical protein